MFKSLSTVKFPTIQMPEDITFEFQRALSFLKEGKRVARKGWNGKGMYLELQVPDEHSKMKRPYIYITPDAESVIPWVASQADLLANDWYEVTEQS